MNKQITRLAVGALVLLSALIVGTTYWQTFAVAGLADRQDNALARVAQFTVDRGKIYTARGHVPLATNEKRKVDGQTYYFRKYPNGYLAPHVIGYSTQSRSRAGSSARRTTTSRARTADLSSVTQRELDKLKGVTLKGNDLLLTLSPRAQQTAVRQLAGKCGGAVAIEPQTGRDPRARVEPDVQPERGREELLGDHATIRTRGCSFAAPLLDRATQGLYPPGSTFKVVTAAAALDSGAYKPTSEFVDPGYCEEYGKRVSNAGNPESPETFGTVTLAQGAPALDQLRLLQHRQADRRGEDPRVREALRLLRDARPRAARRRAEPERAVQEAQAVRAEASGVPGRPRPARVRAGADARVADPDGDGRGDGREPRRADAAAPPARGRLARRQDRAQGEAGEGAPRRSRAGPRTS